MAFRVNVYQLKQVMENEMVNSKTASKVLIVDSRPYIAYNEEHITGACNMYCPPILKRRFANGGQVHLESMLGVETKNRLISGQFSTIVVYDQEGPCLPSLNTLNNNGLGVDISDLNIVYRTLCKLAKDAKCLILKGGYNTFKQQFPSLCTKQNQEDTISSAIDTSNSRLFRNVSVPSEPVELLPHLYIGNALSAAGKDVLLNHGITAILNVSNNCRNHFDADFRYKNIPVDDNPLVDLSTWFMEAITFIDEVKRHGGKTLVHCQAGISRSATICLAYIMQSQCLSLDEAFEFVKSRRSVISPNISFLQQLLDFEKEIQTRNNKRKYSPPASPCRLVTSSSPAFSFFGHEEMPQTAILHSPVQLLQSPVLTFT
ncbi:dual specificity protein phosphatase 4-like [Mizuhopecten yessoensis]|uniref:Dual specificity protein phosphatase 4 n=1 Tax=Mizuhopecten yessoensis TaxID=6573 RepID=A0A210PUN7_MIZYE|nr:dual specificity protein phosphatase 4-like [Mizuhopecten yessoensis]OWF40203.1 Dual specificity protein phosphatase 4 [Mizuhopecten yessoensis]